MNVSKKLSISMDIKEDDQQDEYSNDDGILSKINEVVKDEHIMNTIKGCFIEHNIKYCYFHNHKRKDLVILLRRYKIKVSIAMKLWTAFTNNNQNKPKTDNEDSHKNDIHDKHRSVELIDNKYDEQLADFASSVTESKFSNDRSVKYMLDTFIHGYSRRYFDDKYQDMIKLLVFYYASIDILLLIQLSLNSINWTDLKLIKPQSMNNHPTSNESVSITQKAMNMFCSMALERLNNSNSNSMIQIGQNEWIIIVHLIHDDGDCNIGVLFRYNDKSEHLFVATAIYLDEKEIESKYKLIGLKHNYCQDSRSFNLENIIFIEDDEIYDDDDGDIIPSSLDYQSDF